MQVLTLAELQTPDEAVRRFTPLGFHTGGMLSPEDAAEYKQRVVAALELVSDVPDAVRSAFDRLRTLHSYGLLCYENFTAVVDLSPRVAELALRHRFVLFNEGRIDVVGRDGAPRTLHFENVGALVEQLKQARLRVAAWPKHAPFRGGFSQLLQWARREGLLSGQRARHMERRLAAWRNLLAHPDAHHLLMPVDSAREISDLAEFINRLWGARTPGGRLYPAPIERHVLALAYSDGKEASVGLAESLELQPALREATMLLVLGHPDDEGLFDFDAAYENTRYPCELLLGPATCAEAVEWLRTHAPGSDVVEYVDRLFLIRSDEAAVESPRSPDVAAGLAPSSRTGHWFAVQADYPTDAVGHVSGGHQPFAGPCSVCPADGVTEGSWSDVIASVQQAGTRLTPVSPVPARMPGRWFMFEARSEDPE